jgi:hypothetical protein
MTVSVLLRLARLEKKVAALEEAFPWFPMGEQGPEDMAVPMEPLTVAEPVVVITAPKPKPKSKPKSKAKKVTKKDGAHTSDA